MKRVLIIVVLIAFVFSNVFGVSISDLSSSQKTRYNNERLSVSTGLTTSMTGGVYSMGGGYAASSMSGRTKEVWTSYVGNSPILKSDFFRIAGYPEEAVRYEELIKHNRKMDTIGWAVFGAGTIVSVVGTIMMGLDIGEDGFLDGLIISSVGLGIMTISLPIFYAKKDESMFSVSFAIRIAEDYNESLLEKLAKTN